jgi:hypothetical protein
MGSRHSVAPLPREAGPPSFAHARVCEYGRVWPAPDGGFPFSLWVVTMTPAASVSFFRSEFGDFLYAPIGDERNGMTLSLLSALARLNMDPWEEAARLSQLPRRTAAQKLASLIARLPPGAWTQADCCTIANRLIELLPHPGGCDASSAEEGRGSRRINLSAAPILIAVALGLAALLIAVTREPSFQGDAADTPAYTGSARGR